MQLHPHPQASKRAHDRNEAAEASTSTTDVLLFWSDRVQLHSHPHTQASKRAHDRKELAKAKAEKGAVPGQELLEQQQAEDPLWCFKPVGQLVCGFLPLNL